MSEAFYIQKPTINVSPNQTGGNKDVTLGSIRLGPGNWVIFAKFEVAVGASADTDLSPRNSQFGLEFAGQKDAAFCNLNQGGLDTVVLIVAGTRKLPVAVGGGPLFLNARLFCSETNSDLEVLHLAMTAFSVDTLN